MSPYGTTSLPGLGVSRVPRSSDLSVIEPMSPTLVDEPPAGAGWITEVKWDGYRTQLVKDSAGVRCYTRNGHDWSTRYWPITLTASVMPFKSGILDGEIVVLDQPHRSSFSELQADLSARRSNRFVFIAFDLLNLDGGDLRKLPLVVRRERLERLVQTADGGRIQFSEALPGTPQQVFEVVDRAGLEGVVCKQADSRYVSGKTKTWLKAKAFEEAEFDLVGLRRERGKPAMALLARNGRPAGSAFITLPAGIRERLWERIQSPAKPSRKANTIEPVKPGIVGRVRYLRGEAPLRHATLRDWRDNNET
jgi:bifunctional non-homologous end joining protein LigD